MITPEDVQAEAEKLGVVLDADELEIYTDLANELAEEEAA